MNSDSINLLGAQLRFVGGKKGSRRCGWLEDPNGFESSQDHTDVVALDSTY